MGGVHYLVVKGTSTTLGCPWSDSLFEAESLPHTTVPSPVPSNHLLLNVGEMQTLRWWVVLHPPPDTRCSPRWAVGPSPCPEPLGQGTLKHPNLPNMLHVAFMQPHLTSANAHSQTGPQDPNLAMTASSEPKMSTAEAIGQAGARTTMRALGQGHSPHV